VTSAIKQFHRCGRLLVVGGQTPETPDGTRLHPGRLGGEVSVEQGYAAARLAALNLVGVVRLALGRLDQVSSIVSTLCFVTTTPGFTDLHLVSAGAGDVLSGVFGPEISRATRASLGAVSLPRGNCFLLWATVECRPSARKI
jgi:enamine deaminase RidA (YjgF/YER057c/UK114 family)